jgi:hypothetical protein
VSRGGIDDGALALLDIPCLRDDDSVGCPDDSASALSVAPCLRKDDKAP